MTTNKGVEMRLIKAFTMAEAILVMTILGIIATIMITNLKPAEFRDKGLEVLAKKVLMQIDTATQQIMVNNTQNGKLTTVYVPNSTAQNTYVTMTNGNLTTLYKKYLTTTREACNSTTCPCYDQNGKVQVYLKDGACMSVRTSTSTTGTIFPGESATNGTITGSQGLIFFDVNGTDEPNVLGKDRFLVPLNQDGIFYD